MDKILKLLGICIGLFVASFFSRIIAFVIVTIAITIGGFGEIGKYSYVIRFIGIIITLILIYLNFDKKLLSKDTFKKVKLNEVINIIILGFGLSVTLGVLTVILTKFFPSYLDVINYIDTARNSVGQLIIIIVVAPIYEEIIFRRIIFGYLKENYNIVCAVIVQALIFGLAHGNIVQGIYTFILGVAFALIYIYCDSLVGSMILHGVCNLCGGFVVPTLVNINQIMEYIVVISGILCLVFSILKMKKNMKIYFINRECNN